MPFQGNESEIKDIKFKTNEIDESKIDEYFKLENKNLMLKNPYNLDAIQLDLIEMLFTCTSNSNKMSTFLLYITVNDINDKAPEFLNLPYKFKLKEV